MEKIILTIIIMLAISGGLYLYFWESISSLLTAMIIIFDGITITFLGKYIGIKLRKKDSK